MQIPIIYEVEIHKNRHSLKKKNRIHKIKFQHFAHGSNKFVETNIEK